MTGETSSRHLGENDAARPGRIRRGATKQAGELPGLEHDVRVLRVGHGTAGDRGRVELRGLQGKRAVVLSVVEPGNIYDHL